MYKEELQDDEELLREFTRTGAVEVLGKLYEGYMHLVYGVCMKYLKDRNESKDAVMQIFEKLITEIPKQKIENFKSWLHVVTRNFCLMKLRADKSKQEKLELIINDPSFFMETGHVLHPIDEEEPPFEADLADCIERLKNEQRECIRLFYYMNKCYQEIAVHLETDEKKVKSYLQNAKRNLKICLEEKHERQEKN